MVLETRIVTLLNGTMKSLFFHDRAAGAVTLEYVVVSSLIVLAIVEVYSVGFYSPITGFATGEHTFGKVLVDYMDRLLTGVALAIP